MRDPTEELSVRRPNGMKLERFYVERAAPDAMRAANSAGRKGW
jgi:hypothetical protein